MSYEYDQTGASAVEEEAIWDTDNYGRLRCKTQSEPIYERNFC